MPFDNFSSYNFTDDDLFPFPKLTYKEFGFATIPLVVLGSTGSLACMISMWKYYKARVGAGNTSSTQVLVFNNSIATFLFSSLILPVSIFTLTNHNFFKSPEHQAFCQLTAFAHFALIAVCVFTHCAIAVNRFFSVVLSQHCPVVKTLKVTFVSLLMTWLLPVCVFIWPVLGVSRSVYGYSPNEQRCTLITGYDFSYGIFYKVSFGFIPLGIMAIFYLLIYAYIAISKCLLFLHQSEGVSLNERRPTMSRRTAFLYRQDMQTTKVAFTTSLTFAICYIPETVFGVIGRNVREYSGVEMGLNYWLWIGIALNPMVYLLFNSTMRKRTMNRIGFRGTMSEHERQTNEMQTSRTEPASQGSTMTMTLKGHCRMAVIVAQEDE